MPQSDTSSAPHRTRDEDLHRAAWVIVIVAADGSRRDEPPSFVGMIADSSVHFVGMAHSDLSGFRIAKQDGSVRPFFCLFFYGQDQRFPVSTKHHGSAVIGNTFGMDAEEHLSVRHTPNLYGFRKLPPIQDASPRG